MDKNGHEMDMKALIFCYMCEETYWNLLSKMCLLYVRGDIFYLINFQYVSSHIQQKMRAFGLWPSFSAICRPPPARFACIPKTTFRGRFFGHLSVLNFLNPLNPFKFNSYKSISVFLSQLKSHYHHYQLSSLTFCQIY